MKKAKEYWNVRFAADTIKEALAICGKETGAYSREVHIDDENWEFDSDEEFFAAYRKPRVSYYYYVQYFPDKKPIHAFRLQGRARKCLVTVEGKSVAKIEAVFEIFEKNLEASRLPDLDPSEVGEPAPIIFIGHGQSNEWRDLKDHLTDKHGYRVTAYEVGARAGHTIRDILQELLATSSFALLVLTAEDEAGEGKLRARQNVIHELGLFQGRLGFPRAIAIVERNTELLSNLDGVQQLRFNKGSIAEVFGDVLATLRREFRDDR